MAGADAAPGGNELNLRILAAMREVTTARRQRPQDEERVAAARALYAAITTVPLDEDAVAAAQAELDQVKAGG